MFVSRYYLLGFCFCLGLTVSCQSPPQEEVSESISTTTPNPTLSIAPAPSVTLKAPSATITATPQPNNQTPTTPTTPPQSTIPNDSTAENSPPVTNPGEKPTTAQPTTPNTYENPNLGIRFEYPPNYIVAANPKPNSVDVWQSQDYQAIKAGKYNNSEPPGNVNIAVEANPQKLPVEEWVQTSSSFLSPEDYATKNISGKKAIAFRSSGLLEFEHVVIPSDDGTSMIVISQPEGEGHKQAFDRVLSTLKINRKQ